MQIDRQKINQLLTMGEEEFASFVYSVVLSAGGNEASARTAMGFAPLIRDKLRSGGNELEKILEMLGEEKVRGIFDSLSS